MGPLLFIIYIDDIFKVATRCKVLSYADDTTLYYSNQHPSNLQVALNEDIKLITAWFNNNGLKVNSAKSQFMVINTPSIDSRFENIHIKVGKKVIPQMSDISILGVTLDKHLKWNKHVDGLIRRCKFQLRAFHRSVKYIDMDEKRLLYNSCLASRLAYADVIWSDCALSSRNRIQVIQNIAARAIMGCNKYTTAAPIIKNLNWITLEKKRKLHELVLFHKIIMNKGTQAQTNRLQVYRRQSKFNTRGMGTSNLFTPAFRTNYMKESFFVRNIREWNRLPSEMKAPVGTETFKARLFKHLYTKD